MSKTANKATAKTATTKKVREFEKVNVGKNFFSPKAEGEMIEGSFLRMDKTVGGKYGELEKDEKTGKKVRVQHNAVLMQESGEEIGLPSGKLLNDFFGGTDEIDACKKGLFVRITFLGKKLKKGKSEGDKDSVYNNFQIEKEKA